MSNVIPLPSNSIKMDFFNDIDIAIMYALNALCTKMDEKEARELIVQHINRLTEQHTNI